MPHPAALFGIFGVITFMVVFIGILSNMASDIGYLLIIPLGGVILHALGRHPIAGISAAFAGVSGSFYHCDRRYGYMGLEIMDRTASGKLQGRCAA